MKRHIKILVLTLMFFTITTSIAFADSKTLPCNRKDSLQYANIETFCNDTSSTHYYSISGNASSKSARLYVYIKNIENSVVDSSTSSSYSTFAIAAWTRSNKTYHTHGATSALVQ